MPSIKTRRLGRTGLEIPELGLGAMDTPNSLERRETVEAALAGGIRFIDTAREYAGSEFLLGDVIRSGAAEGVVISSKTFAHDVNRSQYDIDDSLRTLGLPAIDLYHLHDISTWDAWREASGENGALEGLKTAQYRGLIKYIGVSSHNLEVARECIDSGEFDAVMLEYSAFYPESREIIAHAYEQDVGVIVMRPVGGSGRMSVHRGRLKDGSAGNVTPHNLLRYVWSNPHVSVAIPGASYPDRIHANVETALTYEPMSEDEQRSLEQEAAAFYGE
jgi:predicted aldo/keto reductase-like oxidoreductase